MRRRRRRPRSGMPASPGGPNADDGEQADRPIAIDKRLGGDHPWIDRLRDAGDDAEAEDAITKTMQKITNSSRRRRLVRPAAHATAAPMPTTEEAGRDGATIDTDLLGTTVPRIGPAAAASAVRRSCAISACSHARRLRRRPSTRRSTSMNASSRRRPLRSRVGRPGGDELSVVDDADVVAQALDEIHHVAGQHDRATARAEAVEHRPHRARRDRVDALERLVEQQQARPVQHRRRERGLLAHAVAVAGDLAVGVVGELERLEQLVGCARARRRAPAGAARRSWRGTRGRSGVRTAGADRARRRPRAALASTSVAMSCRTPRSARVRAHQPDHRSQCRRLAAAVGADEPVARPVRDGQRQAVDRERLAEPLRESEDAQGRPVRRHRHVHSLAARPDVRSGQISWVRMSAVRCLRAVNVPLACSARVDRHQLPRAPRRARAAGVRAHVPRSDDRPPRAGRPRRHGGRVHRRSTSR